MRIAGISAFFHESAACLLVDGELVAAAAEERFTRVKHDARLPVHSYRYCLEAGGLGPGDVDAVAFYELPELKADRQRRTGAGAPRGQPDALDPGRPERMIREYLGHDGLVLTFPHHLSHAASAYHFSGFDEAAVLTVDGVGEWATATYGHAAGPSIEPFEEVRFPHSLGLFYATITAYLGFRVNDGEYKVMGLAPYGEPRLAGALRSIVRPGPGGQFALDMDCFDFAARMWTGRLETLLGMAPRKSGEPLGQDHADLAASAQLVLEEILLEKVAYLADRTGAADLCFAGGVALNCVANGRILREGPFERLFVPPPAGDDGGSLGAAALAHVELTGERPATGRLARADFGPSFDAGAVARDAGFVTEPYAPAEVAARLAAGQVVGWFSGRMELGPRALGHRSILADPRDPAMRDRVNTRVKRREAFRPFAPSVLAAHAGEHLELDHPAPFMLETCQVASPLELPAVTHVDGSCRPQTVDPAVSHRYAGLLEAFFRRTGCPLLLNTSLNVAGEPIVCTPADALLTMGAAGLDALVLEDVVVDAASLPPNLPGLLEAWDRVPPAAFAGEARNVYALA